jgi:ABC-2 type transport system ATP-binding protein
LHYICAIKDISKAEGRKKTEELLELVNLTDEAEKKIGSYSGGMRQRLGIASAMLSNPELLILDEPTAGLDPKERIRFRNIISKLSAGRIVLLSTHIVSDIEHISNQVILLGGGHLIAKDTVNNLLGLAEGKVWELTVSEQESERIIDSYSIGNILHENGLYKLRVISDAQPEGNAKPQKPTLEDVFLYCFKEG